MFKGSAAPPKASDLLAALEGFLARGFVFSGLGMSITPGIGSVVPEKGRESPYFKFNVH